MRLDVVTPADVRAGALLQMLPSGPLRGAEVGVFCGQMSRRLIDERADLHLLMVDSWEGDGAAYHEAGRDWHARRTDAEQDRFIQLAEAMTADHADRRTLVRRRSVDAAASVADAALDFVFLDGDHSEAGVSADISAWWPKIKDHGLLAGHDYGHADFPGVKAAVDAFAALQRLDLVLGPDCTWFIRKTKTISAERIAFNDGRLMIQVRPPTPPEEMLANMASAIARGLREIRPCKAHGGTLSIAAGGPSLADTYMQMQGHIAAANGSLGFLLDKGVVPHFCGVMDANAHMADIVAADPGVYYFVSSNCNPALFDKLADAKCDVRLWHPTADNIGATPDQLAVLPDDKGFTLGGVDYPDKFMIGGGTSIGLRLMHIGYVLGYRKFHLHGNDASFRGNETHAYWDRRWGDWVDRSSIEINGYRTSLNFLQHVSSFANILDQMRPPRFEPVEIEVFGDGLIQACYRFWKQHEGEMSAVEAFQRW